MLTNQIKIIRIRHITHKYTNKLDLNSKASLLKIIIKIIQHKTHKYKHKIKIKIKWNLNVIVIWKIIALFIIIFIYARKFILKMFKNLIIKKNNKKVNKIFLYS